MFWYLIVFIRCDICLKFKHQFNILSIKRIWNLYFCICLYLETPFAGMFVSFAHTWLHLFLTVTVLTTLPENSFAYYFINIYYLEIYQILHESNCTSCKFSIGKFYCIIIVYITICLLLSWFCLVCGVLNSYMCN